MVNIGKVGKTVGHDSFYHFTQYIKQGNRSVQFRLYVVIFALFTEDYGNRFLKVLGAVAQLEAGVEQFIEAGEKDIKCLVQDAIDNTVGARGFV